MSELRFEWDEAKNRQNIKKHGVSFEEAQTVFLDDSAIRFFDPDHSDNEDRFIVIMSFGLFRPERQLARKPHITGGDP